MISTTEKSNRYRIYPLDNCVRLHPKPYDERNLFVSQGSTKYCPLGTKTYPFKECFIDPASKVTAIRFKQDSGNWQDISLSGFPDLVYATRAVSFIATDFSMGTVFTLEVTAGSQVVTRTVKIVSDVYAGNGKITKRDKTLYPFFDARFATNSNNLTTVQYSIDDGSKIPIPAISGTDMVDRVKSFKLSFDSSGPKKLTLYVMDNAGTPQEFSDSLTILVD